APAAARHSCPLGCTASAGQSLLVPLQLSGSAEGRAGARHWAVLLASAWQAGPVPVQVSARSQAPAAPRQPSAGRASRSGGQSLVTPLQLSATSQAPAAARHWAVLLRSAGQAPVAPSQASARSQAPAAARHSCPLGCRASAGQSLLVPLQLS